MVLKHSPVTLYTTINCHKPKNQLNTTLEPQLIIKMDVSTTKWKYIEYRDNIDIFTNKSRILNNAVSDRVGRVPRIPVKGI